MKKIQKTKHRQPGLSMSSLAVQLEDKGLRLAATSRTRITPPPPVHADDIAVEQLATAMKAKLAASRAEGKRGWDNPLECSHERLAILLGESLVKGNPVNIANFAAMLHARGASHQVIAEQAMRALLRGSREIHAHDKQNAERYLKLRNINDEQLGAAGIPCISMPTGLKTGHHLNGDEADRAIDAIPGAGEPQ